MFVLVIMAAGDGSDSYGRRIHSIRFNTRKAAEECQAALRIDYDEMSFIIEDVRQ